MERRVSEESVMSILHGFGSQGPEDTATINSMVNKAKRAIDMHTGDALLFKRIHVATLLRSLIDVAIDDRGKHYVASAVLAYEKEEEPAAFLVELARVWLTYLLYPVKAKGLNAEKGIPSTQQTAHIQEIALLIESASRGDQKALRKILHLRQGDRCPITGNYGLDASPDFVRSRGGSQAATIACHILPYSLNDFQETSGSVKNAVITWDMIAAWSSFDVRKLAGLKINGPSNGLLLEAGISPMFSTFKLWFEKTNGPNTYIVRTGDVVTRHAGKVVTFVNEHSEEIDLPGTQILELHAAFSRVLHLTGAGECFESYWRDMDEIRVLASDGSTHLDFLVPHLAVLATAG